MELLQSCAELSICDMFQLLDAVDYPIYCRVFLWIQYWVYNMQFLKAMLSMLLEWLQSLCEEANYAVE